MQYFDIGALIKYRKLPSVCKNDVLILNGEASMKFHASIQAYQENAGQFS